MPLGTELGLGPDDIVLDGTQLPVQKWHSPHNLRPMSIVAKGLYVLGYHLVRWLAST